MSRMWSVLFLVTVSVTHGLADTIVFEDESSADQRVISSFFTPQEQECFKEEKFLYEPDKRCYTLLSVGPCGCKSNSGRSKQSSGCDHSKDGWLVLQKLANGRLFAVCRPCRCCDRPLHVYMASDGKCHHRIKERTIFCPHNGTELRDNEFGEGECGCIKSPPHARLLGDSSETCYPLYRTGPCRSGHVFIPDRDPNTFEQVGRCERNPCASFGEGYAQWKNGDGRCYELGTRGPCDNQNKFNVHRTTRIPDCMQPTNAIVDPQAFVDSGPEPTDLPEVEKNFALDLLSSPGRRRGGRRSVSRG